MEPMQSRFRLMDREWLPNLISSNNPEGIAEENGEQGEIRLFELAEAPEHCSLKALPRIEG